MSDVIEAVPAVARLTGARRDRVFRCIEDNLDTLASKIERAPYEPYRLDDPWGVNRDFRSAVGTWIAQFPDHIRLGALAAALSVSYITHDDFDVLVDVSIARMIEKASPASAQSSLSDARRMLRPYPVSVFGVYDRFVHRLRLEGTKDRSARPVHGLLDEFTEHAVNALAPLAAQGREAPDAETRIATVRQIVRSLAGAHVVVLEESTYSGYTITAGLRRLTRLFDLLFGTVPAENSGVVPAPRISIVCLLATQDAVEVLEREAAVTTAVCSPATTVVGRVVDRGQSLTHGLPDVLAGLDDALACRRSLHAEIVAALRFFYREYGWRYLGEDTRLRHRYDGADDDFLYGFKRGGWTIVTQDNCPNNSVPLLWYPHGSSVERRIRPLFQRVESRVSHEARANQLDVAIDRIEEARPKRHRPILREIFEDLHAAAARSRHNPAALRRGGTVHIVGTRTIDSRPSDRRLAKE